MFVVIVKQVFGANKNDRSCAFAYRFPSYGLCFSKEDVDLTCAMQWFVETCGNIQKSPEVMEQHGLFSPELLEVGFKGIRRVLPIFEGMFNSHETKPNIDVVPIDQRASGVLSSLAKIEKSNVDVLALRKSIESMRERFHDLNENMFCSDYFMNWRSSDKSWRDTVLRDSALVAKLYKADKKFAQVAQEVSSKYFKEALPKVFARLKAKGLDYFAKHPHPINRHRAWLNQVEEKLKNLGLVNRTCNKSMVLRVNNKFLWTKPKRANLQGLVFLTSKNRLKMLCQENFQLRAIMVCQEKEAGFPGSL